MNEERSLRGSTAHLDPEELAMLFEGKLPEEKAARLRQHIAECEECHEWFVISAEALDDLQESGEPELEPVPAGGNVRSFRPAVEQAPAPLAVGRLLAFAAMTVLAVLTGFLVHRQIAPAAGPTLAEIVAPLRGEDVRFIEPLPAMRSGTADRQHRLAFGLGVASVQLALQQRAGKRAAAGETLGTMRTLWGSLYGIEDVPFSFEAGPDAALERLEELRRDDAHYFDPLYFDLGVWTEAGRLAAAGGREEYFQGAFHRETLQTLLDAEAELGSPPELRTIATGGQPQELKAAFGHLRESYDPS